MARVEIKNASDVTVTLSAYKSSEGIINWPPPTFIPAGQSGLFDIEIAPGGTARDFDINMDYAAPPGTTGPWNFSFGGGEIGHSGNVEYGSKTCTLSEYCFVLG
mmetsp:Transcript_36516/g.91086  ORF Transcript_36516/g.91086 Transcript_36516/m.91086 type:complete len:104 (+) Transcript_36516:54-365(+)|eukprot:CAMPEP_0179844102 /NCGR_PEP_ID=MMETSP0982-20121206/4130_1 /TAXON_ID=483367 /ORGANISM="non described non described, Strain CCMP 2436" /LENGTH=103 /DNA_ID=CAMNT_0021728717 /DNA_START=44 /DNA_END=355 /DNA_ORIENTATION=+